MKKFVIHFIESFEETPIEISEEDFLRYSRIQKDQEVNIGGLRFLKKHVKKIKEKEIKKPTMEYYSEEELEHKEQRKKIEEAKKFLLSVKEKIKTRTVSKSDLKKIVENFNMYTFASVEILNEGIEEFGGAMKKFSDAFGYEKILDNFFDGVIKFNHTSKFKYLIKKLV